MTEQTIFLSALDIADPAERTAYLDRVCGGDPALRQQVEALLAAHDRSGLFLNEPALEQLAAGRAGDRPTVTANANAPAGPDTPTLASPDAAAARDDDLGFLKPPTRPGSIGRLDRYEVLEVLGRGGFGTVLRAFDERLHRIVAIKVLAPQLAASGTARQRFDREARAGAAVRDEHVVNIYEVSPPDAPVPYLVMEYVAGQTLQQKLDRTGPLSVPEILRIGSQVAKGLAAAHATGHIHRDIKPSNILLENGVERVKITDFGLARAADDASISHSGVVAGTPQYMSPEQAKGERIDHRADLFSLGSVLYAMCTGRPPFRASTTMAVLKRVCEADPRPVREINPEVPDWLDAIIARLHAKKPEDRFQSAGEVADLLQQHLAHARQPGQVPMPARVGVSKPGGAAPRQRWKRAAVAAVGFLAALLIASGYIFSDAARLYVLGMGELRIDDVHSEFETFIVTSDASPEFVNGAPLPPHLPVFVEPGIYRIKAFGKNQERVQEWTITDPSVALGVAKLQVGEECTVEISRGQRVSVSISKWAPRADSPGGDWAQLFNGKDLTGWKVFPADRASWKVENGVLVGKGRPSHLFSERGDFGNFHLRMEARVRRVEKGGAVGLFVRVPFEDPGVVLSPFGKDSLFRTLVPKLYDDTAPPPDPPPPSYREQAIGVWGEGIQREVDKGRGHTWVHPLPDDVWVTHEVIADGGHVTVRCQVPADVPSGSYEAYTALGPKAESKGHIALQLFDARSVVEVRKIEVKELPPDSAVAPALRDAVAAKERSLAVVKAREEAGAASLLDLTLARIELTEARIRLAEAEADRAALLARLQELVTQRQTERDLTEQLVQAGRAAPNVLNDVEARLAAAKARLTQARPGPPAGPQPVKLRSFIPGKDALPLPQRGPASAVTAVGDAWRIENATGAGNFNVLVAQAVNNLPKDGVLVFRAKVKVEATARDEARWGDLGFGSAQEVYPSWGQWPEVRARYGDYITDWTEKEARYSAAEVLKKGATVCLYAGLHANGVLWLKDVELLHLPAEPAPPGPVPGPG